jgi:hypothetical protein
MDHIKRDTNEAPHGWLANAVISQILDQISLYLFVILYLLDKKFIYNFFNEKLKNSFKKTKI